LAERATETKVIAAIRKNPNITAIFFMGEPPDGHHDGKQQKLGYSLQRVLFSEQGSGSEWIH
jgi:hypothetical protein